MNTSNNHLTHEAFKYITRYLVLLSMIFTSTSLYAASFDIINATPLGSWQIRESTETNHKGKQTVSIMKTSLVDKELRDGETYYWVEMHIETFKVKKNGKRKAKGKPMIIKSLVSKNALAGDPENICLLYTSPSPRD